MPAPVIPGFSTQRIPVGAGIQLDVSFGGAGPSVVLLHGFPQTRLMWRHVAADLAADHTVVCPDLRGYGASDKPSGGDPDAYSKRTMATDVVTAAAALGFDRFAVVGHDRGAHVAIRAGLDHPGTVSHVASLDVLPMLDSWDILHGLTASVAFHLYLMAQPAPLPERLIAGAPDLFFGHFLDAWTGDAAAIPADVRAEYLRASREAIPSIVADYRASAGIDLEHDRADREADRRLAMPVTVIQQDWGATLGFDAAALWSRWAADLVHRTVDAGHFMAEEHPRLIAAEIRQLLAREHASS